MIEKIDLTTWDRTDRFTSYLDSEFPYIIIGADLDVTNIHRYARDNGLSFTYCMIYAATKIADEIPNFHYRLIDSCPCRIDRNVAITTHLPAGQDTFIMVRCDHYDTMAEFAAKNREKADRPKEEREPGAAELANDIINFSSIPWVRYTYFIRTIKKLGEDSNPRISFGKYEWENGRLIMPFSVQTHHGLMDGLHVGRYFMRLEEYLGDISG